MVGNAGPDLWRDFSHSPEYGDGLGDPLDRWTARVIANVAAVVGAHPLYPFRGPPWYPFQRWGLRAEPCMGVSPLGMLIHPQFGLWHAYQAALLFREYILLPQGETATHPPPCDTCDAKPCLSACPIGAFDGHVYNVAACRDYLRGGSGLSCNNDGCLARRQCPVGAVFCHEPGQAAFHMSAFRLKPPSF